MMKKYACLLFSLIVLCLNVTAQDYDQEIRKDFSKYLEEVKAKNFEEALDYTYQRFFELVPKEKMVEMMDATFNSPEIDYELMDADIRTINQPELIGNEFFTIFKYMSVIRMKFLTDTENEAQDEFEQRMEMTRRTFEEMYGQENVFYEAETGFYRVNSLKNVCAVSDNGKNGWEFIVMEPQQLSFLEQILPSEIIARVK